MTTITEKEFTNNVAKYLDMAEKERIVITRGKKKLEIGAKKKLISDEDLANALTGDQLLDRVIPRIEQMYKK